MTRFASRRVAVAATLAASLAAPGCGGDTVTSPSPPETLSVKLTTAHFQILADRTDASLLRYVADALEAAYPRITSDLEAAGPAQTHVRVWADRTGLYAELQAIQGNVAEGVRGFTQIPDTFSVRADTGTAAVAECAVHEFTHLVSRSLNPDWDAGRWLRETVSLYEAGQFRNPTSFDYMRAGNYPTISFLSTNVVPVVEQVGYVLAEYIVAKWGTHGLVLLIRASGDFSAALGISTQEFESGWYAFLHEKYGLPSR